MSLDSDGPAMDRCLFVCVLCVCVIGMAYGIAVFCPCTPGRLWLETPDAIVSGVCCLCVYACASLWLVLVS